MHANTPDTLLLDHWRTRRDADAFAELVARYGPLVYSACLRVLRSTAAAEDAAQDCFLELLQSRARVHSLPGFLHTTATRRAVDRLRSERSRADREARFAAGQAITIEATWDDVSTYVDEAIAALPDKLQRPVVLRFLQGRSYAEIASDTGLPASTIQYQLQQGIEGVRKHLAERGLPISAAALGAMLAAAPSQALPAAVAAQIGAMALAGISTTTVAATGLLGGWIGLKAIAAAILVIATLAPAAYVLSREVAPKDRQARNAITAEEAASTIESSAATAAAAETTLAITPVPPSEAAIVDSSPQITGTVLGSDGSPAVDAEVTMYWSNDSWSVRSDKGGEFALSLPDGFVPDDQSNAAKVSLRAEKGIELTFNFTEKYEVPPTGLAGIRLHLEPSSTISGSVVDTDGNPMVGWRVIAEGDTFWGNTISTEKGEFTLSGIRPGNFTIYAEDKEGRLTHYNGGKSMPLEGRMTYTGIILTWPQTAISLAGYVTDENGRPVSGAKLSANYQQSTVTGERLVQLVARTDDTGRYVLAGFPATEGLEVDVQFSHHSHMQAIRYGVRVDGHEENFTVMNLPSIKGRVINTVTREPVTSFRITTLIGQSRAPGFTDEDAFELSNNWDKQESPDGAFTIQARGYGNVRVAVAAPGYITAVKSLSDTLPGAEVEDVEVALEPARPLNGIVVDEAGLPISGAQIFFGYPMYPGRDTHFTSNWEGISQTNDEGEFTLTEYPPTLSAVSAFHDDFALGWTTAKGTSPLRIVLEKGTVIEGTVTFDGAPLENKRAHINLETEGAGIKITFGGEGGAYKMDRVPAGSFVLSAGFHEGGLRRCIRRAVIVERGQTIQQDLNFDGTGSSYIEGVLQLDGQPQPESLIRATLVSGNGDTLLFQTSARGDGTFLLGPIPAGDYDFGAEWLQLQDGSYRSPDLETLSLQDGETIKHDLLYTSP
ncbi:MAG: sigma-70 family RNA polymerase sigma factor [Candidatus Hydrogenedentes bacterium]|nr:sigma-70 family RNA polymerase sigma factor [Candidatus Hydrogenedentota bacterium]